MTASADPRIHVECRPTVLVVTRRATLGALVGLSGCSALGIGDSLPAETYTGPVTFPDGLRVVPDTVVRKSAVRYADGETIRTHEFDRPVWNVEVRFANTTDEPLDPPPADRFRLVSGGETARPREELPGPPTWASERQPTTADELLPPTDPYPRVVSPGGVRVVILLFTARVGEAHLTLDPDRAWDGPTPVAWELGEAV